MSVSPGKIKTENDGSRWLEPLSHERIVQFVPSDFVIFPLSLISFRDIL